MWPKAYKDYPPDTPLIKTQVQPGKGIIGCEMHEINGWGENHHVFRRKRRKSLFRTLLESLFGSKS